MDVSPKLCLVSSEAEEVDLLAAAYYLPEGFVLTKVNPRLSQGKTYADSQLLAEVNAIKEQYDHPDFLRARNAANPLEGIRSTFLDRAALKLANIDALFQLTGVSSYQEQQIPAAGKSFLDLAGGPGAFTQYLPSRWTEGKGHGMSLKSGTEDWAQSIMEHPRMTVLRGPDGTGNLYSNWEYLISFMNGKQVDLVTADGGIDVESQPQNQEPLSARLLLTQAIIGMFSLKRGGSLVLKIFGGLTSHSADTLFLLSNGFHRINLFKPCSSRPANQERYIICSERRDNIDHLLPLCKEVLRSYDKEDINTFLEVPTDFEDWLTERNNISLRQQKAAGEDILALLNSKPLDLPVYDIHKFNIIWYLPSSHGFRGSRESRGARGVSGAGRGRGAPAGRGYRGRRTPVPVSRGYRGRGNVK